MNSDWSSALLEEMQTHADTSPVVAQAGINVDKQDAIGGWDGRTVDAVGGEEDAFTVWTERRIYFPAWYDGMGWVASVPRHPCNEATCPVGGG